MWFCHTWQTCPHVCFMTRDWSGTHAGLRWRCLASASQHLSLLGVKTRPAKASERWPDQCPGEALNARWSMASLKMSCGVWSSPSIRPMVKWLLLRCANCAIHLSASDRLCGSSYELSFSLLNRCQYATVGIWEADSLRRDSWRTLTQAVRGSILASNF